MRKRGGRQRDLGTRAPMALPQGVNQRWSLDFVSDVLDCGRRFLGVVDDFTRDCLRLWWTRRCQSCGSVGNSTGSRHCVARLP